MILGEAPSRPMPGRRPQAPEGPLGGRSGRFLRSLTGDPDYAALAARFELRNLLQEWPGRPPGGGKGSWLPPEAAFRSLECIWAHLGGRTVVTLGARVRGMVWRLCGHASRPPPWFEWVTPFEPGSGPAAWAPIPHPSGLVRIWNSQEARDRGTEVLEMAENLASADSRIPRGDHL